MNTDFHRIYLCPSVVPSLIILMVEIRPYQQEVDWHRNRRLARSGFEDLEYLPKSRAGWNATLAAHAFSARRRIAGSADLNLWAAMHGRPASARYRELEENALVLWHGTSAVRAERIREVGLFHRRGLWTARDPKIAHGYTRGRASQHKAGSATIVLLLDRRAIEPGVDYDMQGPEIFRFHSSMPPENIEYILCDDRIEFLGERKAKWPRLWGIARFKKKEGEWVTYSQPPVRFDGKYSYSSIEEWLHLSIRRILSTLGSASAVEIFSSLYSTINPWDALEHEDIFEALECLCDMPRKGRGIKQFSMLDT
jgi:hypothetical protein